MMSRELTSMNTLRLTILLTVGLTYLLSVVICGVTVMADWLISNNIT